MKKQINPTIKAQVIRSAFYLLLLLAVCVIPFALAQRNAAKRAVVNSPGVPVASYHGTKAPTFHVLPPPKVPNDVLYDQYDNPGTNATGSQDFETANDAFDDFTADDFVVPSGETWNINEVDVQGTYDGFPGPALAFHVFFYTDCAGLPGTQIYSAMNQPYTTSNNIDFVINLSVPAVLGPGTYWASVQCRMD